MQCFRPSTSPDLAKILPSPATLVATDAETRKFIFDVLILNLRIPISPILLVLPSSAAGCALIRIRAVIHNICDSFHLFYDSCDVSIS